MDKKQTILIATNVSNALDFRKDLIITLLKNYNVIITCSDTKYIDFYLKIGCKYVKSVLSQHGMNLLQENHTIASYKKILTEYSPSCVLTFTIKPNIYMGMACGKLNIPCIPTITGLSSVIFKGGAVSKALLLGLKSGLSKAKTVFLQNNYSKDFLRSKKVIKDNYKVLPGSGVNLEEHKPLPYPSDDRKITFITVGRILKDKGIMELLEAARIIKSQYDSVEFKLVGRMDDSLRNEIERSEEEGIIEYCGMFDNIVSFYEKSHATIHPSYHEGMSNALLETAASARPVLASDIPGCIETFDEGVSGFKFQPKNVDDLVNAIKKFIELPYEDKKEMGLSGRKKMEREFDRNIVIKEYIDEINSIIKEK